jgi:hypothetical protein
LITPRGNSRIRIPVLVAYVQLGRPARKGAIPAGTMIPALMNPASQSEFPAIDLESFAIHDACVKSSFAILRIDNFDLTED